MSTQAHFDKLERMYHGAPVNQFHKPSLTVAEGAARIEQAVDDRFFHAAHALHGSVLFKLVDDAGFFAANSLVEDRFVVTVDAQVHFLRPVQGGRLVAAGKVVHHGRRLVVADARVEDGEGTLVARGTGSFMPSKVALDASVGYQ